MMNVRIVECHEAETTREEMMAMTKEEMIEALIDYHDNAECEAEAMDFMECARWHKSVREWLRKDGLRIITEREAYNGKSL